MLSDLTRVQELYHGLLIDLREQPDKSFSEATLAAQGMDEDVLVAVSTVLLELSHDSEREPQENDLLWSQEFVDYLDTLGWELRRKERKGDNGKHPLD